MMKRDYQLDGDNIESAMTAVGHALEQDEFLEPLEEIYSLTMMTVQDNFDGTSTAEGRPWPFRKDDLPHPLLNKSGALMAAATGHGSGHIKRIGDKTLETGVDSTDGGIIYALRQQHGYTGPDSLGRTFDHPPREYMGFGNAVLDRAAGLVADHAMEILAHF